MLSAVSLVALRRGLNVPATTEVNTYKSALDQQKSVGERAQIGGVKESAFQETLELECIAAVSIRQDTQSEVALLYLMRTSTIREGQNASRVSPHQGPEWR